MICNLTGEILISYMLKDIFYVAKKLRMVKIVQKIKLKKANCMLKILEKKMLLKFEGHI